MILAIVHVRAHTHTQFTACANFSLFLSSFKCLFQCFWRRSYIFYFSYLSHYIYLHPITTVFLMCYLILAFMKKCSNVERNFEWSECAGDNCAAALRMISLQKERVRLGVAINEILRPKIVFSLSEYIWIVGDWFQWVKKWIRLINFYRLLTYVNLNLNKNSALERIQTNWRMYDTFYSLSLYQFFFFIISNVKCLDFFCVIFFFALYCVDVANWLSNQNWNLDTTR